MTLRLGLPSKGRLMQRTADWFAARGVTLTLPDESRAYAASIDVAGVEPVLTAAAEIPRELAAGRLHLGVTGMDVLREYVLAWERRVAELSRLGFGRADLVIAVPDVWVDVVTVGDLDAVAAAFRANHGHRLRIATKYHRLVRDYLREAGVADYLLVDSQGATEGAVRHGNAEAIADITTSGDTLRANRLRPLSDGPILASEAALFRSLTAAGDSDDGAALDDLLGRLGLTG